MSSNRKDWTDTLPDILDGYSEAEPEGLWEAVSSGIEPPSQEKRRVVPIVWWYYAGAAALVAAAIAAVVILWPSAPSVPEVVSPGPVTVIADTGLPPVILGNDDNNNIPQSVPSGIVNVLHTSDVITEEPTSGNSTEPDTDVNSSADAVDNEPPGQEDIGKEDDVSEIGAQENSGQDNGSQDNGSQEQPPIMPTTPNRQRSITPRVSVFYAASGFPGQLVVNSSTGIGIPSVPGYRSTAMIPQTKAIGPGSGSAPTMLSRNKASTTEATHSQEARKALGIVVMLDKHWGIESGIVFSDLKSQFNTSSGISSSKTSRTISYAGIPLYAHYNILEWKRIGLYANAGPMYEFSTTTKTETVTYLEKKVSEKDTDTSLYIDSKWSLNAGAGIRYNVFKEGAIFVQPGFSYHFKDDSALETFYTSHPAAFNITFGFSFQF